MIYSSLAPIYDRVMSHVEYDRWLGLIERVTVRYSSTPAPRVFEIGGGTGVLGMLLKRAGYSYYGSDRSFAMCRQACSRQALFLCTDARNLPLKQCFDLILFLYDGINYLHTAQDYGLLFRETYTALNSEGLFLFDITTQTNSLKFFLDHIEYEDYGDHFYVRHSSYDTDEHIQYNDFTILSRSKAHPEYFTKSKERHVQKLFSAKTVKKWIPTEIFSIIGIWDGFTFQKSSRRSERIHFLLRKRMVP